MATINTNFSVGDTVITVKDSKLVSGVVKQVNAVIYAQASGTTLLDEELLIVTYQLQNGMYVSEEMAFHSVDEAFEWLRNNYEAL